MTEKKLFLHRALHCQMCHAWNGTFTSEWKTVYLWLWV